jgi:dipeptidyl aminopeptidase/acylaminoacyl peptidase
MERALKHAGKPVEAIYFDDDEGYGNNGFVSIEANRIAFLKATEAFLKKNIGP